MAENGNNAAGKWVILFIATVVIGALAGGLQVIVYNYSAKSARETGVSWPEDSTPALDLLPFVASSAAAMSGTFLLMRLATALKIM